MTSSLSSFCAFKQQVVPGKMQNHNKEIQQLKCRNIRLEAYTRRESIKIYNLQEIEGETQRDTENLVRSMMEEKMKISRVDMNEIRFERVHRLPTRRNPRSRNTRPVIAFGLKLKILKGLKLEFCMTTPKKSRRFIRNCTLC